MPSLADTYFASILIVQKPRKLTIVNNKEADVDNPQNGNSNPQPHSSYNQVTKIKRRGKGSKVLIGVCLVISIALLGGATFLFFRTSSFITATTGGRNVGSSLTAIPSKTPSRSLIPISNPTSLPTVTAVAAAPTNQATTVLAQPTPNVGLSTPIVTPIPTVAANLPAIVKKIQTGDPFNLMVLGYGGVGHDGAFLTDTILIIHYDAAKKAVVMTNIPRDLFVFVPYGGQHNGFWGKINSAFAYVMESSSPTDAGLSSRYSYGFNYTKLDAAANLTKDVVEQVTGVSIDYWATFNFNGFRKLVEAIGGVDITVDTAFDDYEYPANDNADVDASVMHIHFNTGPQHLNGERAIEFARSRKSAQDGTDFGRSKRQMKLIQALKDKMSQPSVLLKAFDIMDALQDNVRTSFTFDELHGLFDFYRSPQGKDASANLLFVSQILSTNLLYDQPTNGYILLPNAGQGNYQEIQQWIEQGYENPQVRSENASLQVHNASGITKYNTTLPSLLDNAGFQDVGLDWSPTQTQTVITDYSLGKNKYSLQALQNLFPNATIKTALKSNQSGPDLAITIGQNYGKVSNSSKTDNQSNGVSSH